MMDRTHKEFSQEDIAKVAKTIHDFQQGKPVDEKGFAAVVTTDEIAKQDYMLTPGRYVGVAEEVTDDEPIAVKLPRLQKELAAMFEESHRLEKEITKALASVRFYSALTATRAVKDFYEKRSPELIALTKELTDTLRKNRTIDWQLREAARAKMRLMVKKLLKKYKYPPNETQGAMEIVLRQCEFWTDNASEERNFLR